MLRIDRRGFGKSDPMPADFPWSLDIMVDDTVSFIEAQAPEGVHVIGCKIATPLSIRLAVRREAKVHVIAVKSVDRYRLLRIDR